MSAINFEKQKQPELVKHDASILDLAFAMDATGSMGPYIQNAQKSIRQIVEEIVASEKSDINLALIEYRDHEPQDHTFVTRTHDFTSSVKEMKGWLENCKAVGGGDLPEAVADALHDALKLSWREKSTKICVLISDAPPHGLSTSAGDSFPQGCPAGIDPIDVAKKMAQKGIILYCVGVEPLIVPYKDFFSAIAFMTGGQYVPLNNAEMLAKVIIGSAQEEISLNKLTESVEKEIQEQTRLGITDEMELARAVENSLKSKGIQTKQLKMNGAAFEKVSDDAVMYSKMTSLSDVRSEYTKKAPTIEMNMPHMKSYAYAAPMSMRAMPPHMKMSYPMMEATKESADSSSTPGAMSAATAFESAPMPADYSVETNEINTSQAYRMVSKVLNSKKK